MSNKIILKGRLNGSQRMRLGKLLDMLYKPSELSSAIGFTLRQVYRVYLDLGCPCVREDRHIWINGKVFAEWYEATYPKYRLLEDEVFCLTCKKAVKMVEPIKKKNARLYYWICKCPVCGRKISKIIDKERL